MFNHDEFRSIGGRIRKFAKIMKVIAFVCVAISFVTQIAMPSVSAGIGMSFDSSYMAGAGFAQILLVAVVHSAAVVGVILVYYLIYGFGIMLDSLLNIEKLITRGKPDETMDSPSETTSSWTNSSIKW